MKTVSSFTTNAWQSGDYVGDQRPVMKATIQKMHMRQEKYQYPYSASSTWKHWGFYRTALFNLKGPARELPSITSVKYDRSVDQDVATMTLTMANVAWVQNTASENDADFDLPGWYTPNRGVETYFGDDWGYEQNTWKGWIIPDRLIRTYEGYGTDGSLDPEEDAKLYPSGVWLIDDVDLTADGVLTITCRDLGRLFLDHWVFPPVIPYAAYPISWEAIKEVDAPNVLEPAGDWESPTFDRDTNELYFADGTFLDGTAPAVNGGSGEVHTHLGEDAFDDNTATHWLSVGSEDPNAFEFIQGTMTSQNVAAVKLNVRGGPYKVYISVFADGAWKGGAAVPYEKNDDCIAIAGAKIKYVKAIHIPEGDTREIKLPRVYHNVTKIRFTFQSRWDSGIGQLRHYRVGLQEAKFCNSFAEVAGSGTVFEGNYSDYTDIIKWAAAWVGFWWPEDAKETRVDGTHPAHDAPGEDEALTKGNVWGDLRQTKTTGVADLGLENFDKRQIMDMISHVRDIVGFDFWIDERGGVVWRLPNLFKKGNWLMPANGGPHSSHTASVITVDEQHTLIDLSVKLSSKNVRERVFVSDVNGRYGRVVHGYNPAPSGMRRVSGWTDQHFKSRSECTRMANLIAIRQFHEYRKNQLTIAANPAIQIDDQIIIKERVTGEGYLHRVLAISSNWEAETGQWTYTLTTNWLGPAAFTNLAWHPERMPVVTQLYLEELGAL